MNVVLISKLVAGASLVLMLIIMKVRSMRSVLKKLRVIKDEEVF